MKMGKAHDQDYRKTPCPESQELPDFQFTELALPVKLSAQKFSKVSLLKTQAF